MRSGDFLSEKLYDEERRRSKEDLKNKQSSTLHKTQSERDASIFKIIIMIVVILFMVAIGATRLVETLSALSVTSDFTNAQTIAETIRHNIILKVIDEDIGHVSVNSRKKDVTVPLKFISPVVLQMIGEEPKIMAQRITTEWRIAVNVRTGVVKVYAGSIQLSPRLSKYDVPYDSFFKK